MQLERGTRSLLYAAAAVAALVVAAAAAGATTGNAPHRAAAGHLKHVFVIMLENHSKNSVIGDPAAPYITQLADEYGLAANYYGVTHPSEPNYVALISGSTFGRNIDDGSLRFDAPNLVDQLEATGHTWGVYEESMPEVGWLGNNWPADDPTAVDPMHPHDALYANKHNPFVLFTDIRNNPARLAHIKPYTALAGDLNGRERSIPDFVFIAPNQCHDMHGGVYGTYQQGDGSPCPYSDAPNDAADESLKAKADAWVHQAVETIMSSKAWSGNSAIFIVADESDYTGSGPSGFGDTSGCCDSPVIPQDSTDLPDFRGQVVGGGHAPAIVITRNGPRHFVSETPYNHYSLLTTIEQNWHLGYLGYAGDTAGGVLPMNDLLGP